MRRMILSVSVVLSVAVGIPSAGRPSPAAPQASDLSAQLAAGKLRAVNREVTALSGDRRGVHLSEKDGPGVAWIEGTDFGEGTIEADVRGRDVMQRSFVGLAFHRRDDATYEAVYVRPFNFRATDPVRHQHAVQYIAMPDYDWPRLRKEFPEEFERPVDASVSPTDWLPLKVVVRGARIEAYVGSVKTPTLEVRKLGSTGGGAVGLWVGSGSDGDFANLRISPGK